MNFSSMFPIVVHDLIKLISGLENASNPDCAEQITRIRAIVYLLGSKYGDLLRLSEKLLKELDNEKDVTFGDDLRRVVDELRDHLAGKKKH